MMNVLRNFLLALVLNALIAFCQPYIETALYASRLAASPLPDRLPQPVQNVRASALRDTWHARRTGGRRHEGIDIFAARGTPVRATTEGIVLRIGTNRLGGKAVWVLGPGGQRHYYAHLDDYAQLASGERIRAGMILGYVGNTGNAQHTPPHLHYGIYTSRGAINPFPLLAPDPSRDGASKSRQRMTQVNGDANARTNHRLRGKSEVAQPG